LLDRIRLRIADLTTLKRTTLFLPRYGSWTPAHAPTIKGLSKRDLFPQYRRETLTGWPSGINLTELEHVQSPVVD
jgi:hypothetical protein